MEIQVCLIHTQFNNKFTQHFSQMVTAVEEMKKVISLADIMKVSDQESLLLTGASNYEDASDEFLKMGEDGNKISCNYTGKAGGITGKKGSKRNF